MMHVKQISAVAFAGLLASCGGDSSSTCPTGTIVLDGQCVADDGGAPNTTAMPNGGAFRELPAVVLSSDEPATIHYTIDGSEPTLSSPSGPSPVVLNPSSTTRIRFFGVDAAGNTENPNAEIYELDRDAPGPVENFAAAPSGSDVTVTWSAPSVGDSIGVVVARAADLNVTAGPMNGSLYDVGDALPGGQEVVAVGTTTDYLDGAVVPGSHNYVAWAYDALGNYGPLSTANALVALPPQTGTLVVDVAAGTAVVQQQPANMTLSASTTFNAGTLTVTVGIENGAARTLFNPKLVLTQITGTAGAFSNSDGDVDGDPFRYYGPTGLAVGESRQSDLQLTTVAADDVVTFDLEVADAPMLVGINYTGSEQLGVFDTKTRLYHGAMPAPASATGSYGGYVRFRGGHISKDGTRLYFGSMHQPVVVAFDTATLGAAQVRQVDSGGLGYTFGLLPSNDGQTLYAGVVGGARSRGSVAENPVISVVRLTTGSLLETGRVTVPLSYLDDDNDPLGRGFSVSQDKSRAAMVGTHQTPAVGEPSFAHVIDLDTMTEVDTDSATEGIQAIDLTGVIRPSITTFSPDGSTLYIGGNSVETSHLVSVDLATYAITPVDLEIAPDLEFEEVKGFAWATDGTLYIATSHGVATMKDGVVGQVPVFADRVRGLTVLGDGTLLINNAADASTLQVLNPTTGAIEADYGAGTTLRNHSLPITPY